MSSEALNQDHGAPESGERPLNNDEIRDRVRNEKLEKSLLSTEPSREGENAGGDTFLKDAEDYLALDKKIEAKQQEIWDVDNRVPKGADISKVLSGLTAELRALQDRKKGLRDSYGEDAELFHADAETLGDLRGKIADRKAKVERIIKLHEANKAKGLPDQTNASLLKGLGAEMTKLQGKYQEAEAMLVRHYGGSTAEAKNDIANLEIDNLLGETDKEIDAALSALDAENLMPEPKAVMPPPLPGRKADMPPMPRGEVTREDLGADTVRPSQAETVSDLSAEEYEDIAEKAEVSEPVLEKTDYAKEAMDAVFKAPVGETRQEFLEKALSKLGVTDPVAELAKRSQKNAVSRFFGKLFSKKDALLSEYDALTNAAAEKQARENEAANRGTDRYKQAMQMRGRQGSRLGSGEGRSTERK